MKISEFCKTNEILTSTFNRWLLEDKMNLKKAVTLEKLVQIY